MPFKKQASAVWLDSHQVGAIIEDWKLSQWDEGYVTSKDGIIQSHIAKNVHVGDPSYIFHY